MTPAITPKLEALIEKVEKDRKQGKNISGPFTAKEAIKYLSSL